MVPHDDPEFRGATNFHGDELTSENDDNKNGLVCERCRAPKTTGDARIATFPKSNPPPRRYNSPHGQRQKKIDKDLKRLRRLVDEITKGTKRLLKKAERDAKKLKKKRPSKRRPPKKG